jgi:hypothetical protein
LLSKRMLKLGEMIMLASSSPDLQAGGIDGYGLLLWKRSHGLALFSSLFSTTFSRRALIATFHAAEGGVRCS